MASEEVWTEPFPPGVADLPSRILVTAERAPQGGWVVTFATEGVKSRTELCEILETALRLARNLRIGSGPHRT